MMHLSDQIFHRRAKEFIVLNKLHQLKVIRVKNNSTENTTKFTLTVWHIIYTGRPILRMVNNISCQNEIVQMIYFLAYKL